MTQLRRNHCLNKTGIITETDHQFTYLLWYKVQTYHRSGTGIHCCIATGQMLPVHSPGGSNFLREMSHGRHLESMTSTVKSKMWLRQSMWIVYLLEEHPCQISSRSDLRWRSLRLFWRQSTKQDQPELRSSVISVVKYFSVSVSLSVKPLTFYSMHPFLPRDASAERGDTTVSRLSVCLSVRPPVTFRYQQHIGWNSSEIISRPNSLGPLLWLMPNMGDLVQREHPQN